MRVYIISLALVLAASAQQPTITGVYNAVSYTPIISSAALITIFGKDLSQTPPRGIVSADIQMHADGLQYIPTTMDGVQVRVNGQLAYLVYVAPDQINAQAPDNIAIGTAQVEVTNGHGRATASVQADMISPGLVAFDPQNRHYVAAVNIDGTLSANATVFPSLHFWQVHPARPRSYLSLWGTGFGITKPSWPAGSIPPQLGFLVADANVHIGTTVVPGFISSAPGFVSGAYQIGFPVPDVPDGDYAIYIEIGGKTTQQPLYLNIQKEN